MTDDKTSRMTKNLERFVMGVNSHDRENPPPHSPAYGVGLNPFDIERLGLEVGEEIVAGITVHADDGPTGNFRVLCDGDHAAENEATTREDVTHAVGSEV